MTPDQSGTLVMHRSFAARPETVFRVLTSPDTLLDWWGPEGTRIAENALDFSRPGPWHATMVSPGGEAARVLGEVLEVDPPSSVRLTLAFDMGGGRRGPTSTIHFSLAATSDGTDLTLTQTGLDPAHVEDMRLKGWASALDRLTRLIATR